MAEPLQFPPESPEFEVWIYLEMGLDHARNQIEGPIAGLDERPKGVGAAERALMNRWADLAFSGLTQLALDSETRDEEMHQVRRVYNVPGAAPWLDFAVDLRFASEGVERAQTALERYGELREVRLPAGLSKRSQGYVTEAAQTFLFGFDAACITFCGAAVEQELKDACVRAGIYTGRRVEKEAKTGKTVLEDAKRNGLIKATYSAAHSILSGRNAVLHRGMHEGEKLREEALQHLITMSRVFHELDQTSRR